MKQNGLLSRGRRWARPGRRDLQPGDDRWVVDLLRDSAARDVADACRHAPLAKSHWS
jgi:hypothetical protein